MLLKKWIALIMSVVLLSFTFHGMVEGKQSPTYEDIFEQQLKIYETEKYIKRNQTEKEKIEKEIPLLTEEISNSKEQTKKQMKEVKDMLLKMYGGENSMWIDMYLQMERMEDVLTVKYVSDEYTEEQLTLLKKLNDNLNQLKKDEKKLKTDEKRIDLIIQELDKKLKDLKQTEDYYKKQLGMVDDVQKAKKQVKKIIKDWENKGKPSFREIFRILAQSIQDLPGAIDKSHIKSKSLFTHEITLTDKELNEFLAKKNAIFNQMKFTFDNNQLSIKGTYKKLTFEASGHYALKSSKEMRFYIDELKFENVKLPKVTIDEMEEHYNLGFYPSNIIDGAEIKKLKIDDGKMVVEVKL